MTKILFVCLGNICRSPMAEFIMKDLAGDRLEIASAATGYDEIINGVGNPVYPPAAAELKRHGISAAGKRAEKLLRHHYDEYDLIIGMDNNNIRNMLQIFGGDPAGKVKRMMDFTDRGGEVADPWFTRKFDVTYRDVHDGCVGLLQYLEENGLI